MWFTNVATLSFVSIFLVLIQLPFGEPQAGQIVQYNPRIRPAVAIPVIVNGIRVWRAVRPLRRIPFQQSASNRYLQPVRQLQPWMDDRGLTSQVCALPQDGDQVAGLPVDRKARMELIYGRRAFSYERSFHPRQVADYAKWAAFSTGMSVLDLACGTGLLTFLAAEAVGPTGRVIGVDISENMLMVAKSKLLLNYEPDVGNTVFIQHDVADVNSLPLDQEEGFDRITCSSAMVIIDTDVSTLLKNWAKLLKPGGKIIFDAPEERSILIGYVLAEVMRRRGWVPPFDSKWVDRQAMIAVIESAGLKALVFASPPYKSMEYSLESGLASLKSIGSKGIGWGPCLDDPAVMRDAQAIYTQEFNKLAVNGIYREQLWFWMGVGTKPL